MANGELLSALVNRAVENEGCQTLALSIHSSDGWTRIADAEFELGGVAQLGGYQAVHLSTHFDDFGRAQLVEVLLTPAATRSEEHTSELQSLMRISYAVFCLKKKKEYTYTKTNNTKHINI